MRAALLASASAATLGLLACTDPTAPALPAPPVVDSGGYHTYVQTGWTLPQNPAEALTMGFDLDDDGTVDNQAGYIISALGQIGLELDGTSKDAFAAGELVALHRIRADSLTDDASVSWELFAGAPADRPRFDGTDRFTVAGDTGVLLGEVAHGHLRADWGNAVVRLPFFPGQHPLPLPLAHAQVDVALDGRCAGRLGGVVRSVDVEATILPVLAAQVVTHMGLHPEHSFTRSAIRIFDQNGDGVVTATEVRTDDLIESLFRPDTDLDGDGDLDGISFGLGFAGTDAAF